MEELSTIAGGVTLFLNDDHFAFSPLSFRHVTDIGHQCEHRIAPVESNWPIPHADSLFLDGFEIGAGMWFDADEGTQLSEDNGKRPPSGRSKAG